MTITDSQDNKEDYETCAQIFLECLPNVAISNSSNKGLEIRVQNGKIQKEDKAYIDSLPTEIKYNFCFYSTKDGKKHLFLNAPQDLIYPSILTVCREIPTGVVTIWKEEEKK